ncbi:hypothetical protein Tdes44962_MAKER06472 [Teratosphaeria destructans]|uniref:Uncharacterized protein n=1 Tax=Teratosphaeria destructans TaxID=418781 RepID=A0A9W7T191_9PEZI|nr:hypothetical protein Tdes44962_MAKER06472 [Teratosphaeria destructans]
MPIETGIKPDGPLEGTGGLLAPIGDTVGQVLDKGLRPVGHVTGQVGRPSGEALLRVQEAAKEDAGLKEPEKEDDKPGGERIGGNAQTGQNPLGL